MSEFNIEKLYETRDSYLNILKQVSFQLMMDPTDDEIKQFKEIKTIIYVYNKKHKKHFKDTDLKGVKLIEGGKTRHESTYNALNYLIKKKKAL